MIGDYRDDVKRSDTIQPPAKTRVYTQIARVSYALRTSNSRDVNSSADLQCCG